MAKTKTKKDKPIILVTNDDGITAPGIRALVEAVKPLGKILVVAPDKPQSGMGHAITIGEPLRLEPSDIFEGIESYQCSGTPADCVKLAKDKLLNGAPALCVSGINHGSNSSINVIYSGTMSGAVEASIEGLEAVGFSLCDYSYHADFEASVHFARKIAQALLDNDLPKGTLLNVNIPPAKLENIKGIKICRQADAKWVEEYDERRDPRGKKYFWLTGKFTNNDRKNDTDEWALDNGYVSVVPVQFDLTAHHAIRLLRDKWKWND